MRRILTVPLLLLAVTGCSSGSTPDGRSAEGASCASRITWHGAVYYGAKFPSSLPATLTLGTGGRPTCSDSTGGEAGASSVVEVRRLAGVDPGVAVAVRDEEDVAYLARGYFVQLPSHPLHRALQRSVRSRSELRGCAERRPVRFDGIVRYRTGAGIGVATPAAGPRRYVRREAVLFVDAYTQLRGLSRNGLPYVAPGQRISVEAVACLWPDGRLRKLVPRGIAPA